MITNIKKIISTVLSKHCLHSVRTRYVLSCTKHASDTLSLSHLRNSRIGLVKYDAATQLRCPSAAIKRRTGRRALQFARLEPTGFRVGTLPCCLRGCPSRLPATDARCGRSLPGRAPILGGWLGFDRFSE
ncbi:hypothetical protein CDAR_486781 [Caerostris darwini]|uniref:Uncharacterized protein n=1 Tax=Caerostris darwini TaxID=1538125 RepID=A0AAV4P0U8_9ARAC|nr:hypothetical protein CDAR_486781 [Caerostris darwini]